MNQLVYIENNRPVTDSLTVAKVFGKRHDHVIRDIESQIEKLIEAGEEKFSLPNFGETHYVHPQNKQLYKKYLLTEDAFTLIAMSYTTVEVMKMKVKFIEEFKLMKDELQNNIPNLTKVEAEALALHRTADMIVKIPKLEQKIESVEQKVDKQITITQGEQRGLQKKISSRVYMFSQDKEERRYLFAEIYRDIKDRWGVPSYRDVLRQDRKDVVKYVNAWVPKKKDEEKGEIA
ncbi:Rha family transcriptional regulator [Chengkuizengella marina]|uniref:ORF6C domain-containing protein n=1 Tax=Chengkuizengella marina TaxID=2507566 RepID=A0A6N9Q7P1_9BACL|nr:Rha family transcriptional regulator [Chengkuizengella marina]NBI30925.1 hypothetical protein [Chengkuizengella marina]